MQDMRKNRPWTRHDWFTKEDKIQKRNSSHKRRSRSIC